MILSGFKFSTTHHIMKLHTFRFQKIAIIISILLSPFLSNATDFAGTWQGRLQFMKFDFRIVFELKKSDDGQWACTVKSPDQSPEKFHADEVTIIGDSIAIDISEMDASYNGKFMADSNAIIGKMTQRGFKLPLKLLFGKEDDLLYFRPQRPKPPFNYYSEEVQIINRTDGDTLSGTFTRPKKKGKYPVVVLISGSGAQDRDETIFGHKPFLLLADYLTKSGYAVLRCDDRGTGKSTGNFSTATTADFSKDVEAQVEFLNKRKDVNRSHIGLLGHSEGAIIAPLVASNNKNIDFIILMAAPAINMFDLLLAQDSLIMKKEGAKPKAVTASIKKNTRLFELLKSSVDSSDAQSKIANYLDEAKASDREIEATIKQLCSPWMRWYINYDPKVALQKINCAVLAINGAEDVQVPASINIPVIDSMLTNKQIRYSTKILPGLNHLFQPCKTCDVAEYKEIDTTMSPEVLELISDWLNKDVMKKK